MDPKLFGHIYVKSVKKYDTDLFKQILDKAGIKANKEQIVALYDLFCDALGTEYFLTNVLMPVIAEMKFRDTEEPIDDVLKYLC